MSTPFTGRPARGRIVAIGRHVGLSDVRPDSTLRLDGLARFLQDVSDRDAVTAGLEENGVWVLRRLAVKIAHTPKFRADVTLQTWCSGVGARWAERRSDVQYGDLVCVEAAALWVHVDPVSGKPVPLPDGFDECWGASANGRRVRPTLHHGGPPSDSRVQVWPLRASDLDVLGHVNNAVYWAAVEDELASRGGPRVTSAEIEIRAGLDRCDEVEIHTSDTPDGFALWYCVAGDVRASAFVACAP